MRTDCSGIGVSSCRHTSNSWFAICGTGTSSGGMTSVPSICSTVRRSPVAWPIRPRTWPLHWRSSVPVGLRASRATHLVGRCGEWPPPVPLRRSAARDATEHAAAAPFSASRSSECCEQPCAARWGPLKHHQTHVRGQAWDRRLLLLFRSVYSTRVYPQREQMQCRKT